MSRLQKLWKLVGRKVDGMLVTSPENVRYLSGFTGSEGTLILTRREGIFLSDGRYATQAQQQVTDFHVRIFKEKWPAIGRSIKQLGITTLGFESRQLTVASLKDIEKQFPAVQLQPCADELNALRAVKQATEIEMLKEAARIAAESLREVVPLIKPDVREVDIAVELEYRMRSKGGEAAAFPTIVASGYRAALPHGTATEKKIKKGEFVVIDYGLVYRGYHSDETCTFVVGRPTAKQQTLYTAVKQAHDRALRAVAPGRPLNRIDAAARSHITRKGFQRYFNHGTGHGIGLSVHEPPVVSSRSQETATAGMVFTIEPGIYLPGWGGVRVEDTVAVTRNGCELITRTFKDLKSMML